VRLLAWAVVPVPAWTVAIVVLLPPRGSFDNPQYYAHGADIPVALRAVEKITR
jgi:hypothetical protein